jgi:tRNA(Ile)-lysidine synthase
LSAVSGGIDSMVMTHLLLRAEIETGIAHCNFSLRGTESDLDEELVRKFASDNELPFYNIRFATLEYARHKGISVQMAARELRYEWFEAIRSENGFNFIAVAHNLNDNIETMLINLTRGTGISGLTGMRSSGNMIIRPLLFATRKEIEEYSRENNVLFREDSSNAETKYARNKIRHLVLPVMREINPAVETTLNDTSARLNDIYELVEQLTDKIRQDIFRQAGENFEISIATLRHYTGNRSLLFELFKPFGITDSLVTDLLRIISGRSGGQIFTSSHRIVKNRTTLIAITGKRPENSTFIITCIDDFSKVSEIKSAYYIDISDEFKIPADLNTGYFDAETAVFPMTVRRWEPGDFFFPLGMTNKKKLSDFFTDEKMSVVEKENIHILESAGEIVWVMGKRIDHRYRITKATVKALVIELKETSSRSGYFRNP